MFLDQIPSQEKKHQAGLPRYPHVLGKKQKESTGIIVDIAAQISLALDQIDHIEQKKQGELFEDAKKHTNDPQIIFDSIEKVLRTYNPTIKLTAEQYVQVLEKCNIPKVVVHSYIKYREFFMKNSDVVGRIRFILHDWISVSIYHGSIDNQTFTNALTESYSKRKSPTQDVNFKAFFKANNIPFKEISPLITYLVYRHTGELPVGKIIKDVKS